MSLVARGQWGSWRPVCGQLTERAMEHSIGGPAELWGGAWYGKQRSLFQTALAPKALHTHESVLRGPGEPAS